MTLARINALDRAAFTAALGHLFEHSPWIAEETWRRRPFGDAAALHAALCATLREAAREQQLTLLRAHPDLAGRLAQQRKLTADSAREQASAGLTQLTAAELGEFQRLNDNYRARFGFPFIICARLNAKDTIRSAMQDRISRTPEEEFQTALGEVEKIARIRLGDVLAG